MKNIKFILIAGLIIALAYTFINQAPYADTLLSTREKYQSDLRSNEDKILSENAILNFYQANESFKVKATFEKTEKDKKINLAMTDTSSEAATLAGLIYFKLEGKEYKLMAFEEGEMLMIPFKDLSNSKETYGGGRYINVPVKNISDGKLDLDFNLAYNFYCAYNHNFICPIPPKENTLPLLINAGEKKPTL